MLDGPADLRMLSSREDYAEGKVARAPGGKWKEGNYHPLR